MQGRYLHLLSDILGLILYGVIADCDDFDEISDYGKDNIGFLQQELGLSFPHGIASADTLNRVIRHLDSHSLEQCFKECIDRLLISRQAGLYRWQRVKRHYTCRQKACFGRYGQCMVNEHSLSFGQVAVEAKSNEIAIIPALLETLDCQDNIITIDAGPADKRAFGSGLSAGNYRKDQG